MNLHDPFGYIKQQCAVLEIPLTGLCEDAHISRSAVYQWGRRVPESIEMLARVEDIFNLLRERSDEKALHQLNQILLNLNADPKEKAEFLARLSLFCSEYR